MKSATTSKRVESIGSDKFVGVEKFIDLEAIVEFDIDGRKSSAFMSRKSDKYQFTFGWRLKGIQPTKSLERFHAFQEAVSSGLQDLPQGECLTVHYSSFSEADERVQELRKRAEKAPCMVLRMVAIDEIDKVQTLARKGKRNNHETFVYCTYTISPEKIQAKGLVEGLIVQLDQAYQKYFIKSDTTATESNFLEMLNSAHTRGFLVWEQLLETRMEFSVTPLDASELWVALNKRFGNFLERGSLPPQLMRFNGTELEEDVDFDHPYYNCHLVSHLFLRDVPVADCQGVKIKDNLVGVGVLANKPVGWKNSRKRISYMWDTVFSRIPNVEMIVQITSQDPEVARAMMNLVMKQNETAQRVSTKFTDVAAKKKADQAIEAQSEIMDGAVPQSMAIVFLVHRQTQAQLDAVMLKLENSFRQPAEFSREVQYAWSIWLQTLPVSVDRLLLKPFNRRVPSLHKETSAFMSLTSPFQLDTTGVEFLTEDGSACFHIDIVRRHRNLALFATTRAGKSVVVTGILAHASSEGVPVIAIDIPPSKAASTFQTFCDSIGGNYIDVNEQSQNIFRIPPSDHLDEEDKGQWLREHIFFCQKVVQVIVPNGANDPSMQSIINISLDMFFSDPEILQAFEDAEREGLDSDAWKKIPTLVTYCNYLTTHKIAILGENTDPEADKQFGQIDRAIKGLLTGAVGRAIGRPCTVVGENSFTIYALRGIATDDSKEAGLLAMAAYAAALRLTLKYPASIFFIDEFSVLLGFPAIGELVSRLTANAAKAGVRVILAAQDPDTLANSIFGPKILQNLAMVLVGKINPQAKASFTSILGLPSEIVDKNADESFQVNSVELSSTWLVDQSGNRAYVKYFSPLSLLAMVANNPNETTARSEYLKYYGDNLFAAFYYFSRALAEAYITDSPIRKPGKVDDS